MQSFNNAVQLVMSYLWMLEDEESLNDDKDQVEDECPAVLGRIAGLWDVAVEVEFQL